MRYLSICSGIEAASVAWHGLGWEPVAFSEIEPFPSAVLAHHYPHVPNLGDMTTLPERILSRELEAPDLLVGGPPCQAFSVAGLRRGLDDARGSLTLTYCEIADAIDHVRLADGRDPAIIVYENVPGLLSSKDNAFGCLLAGLAGESEALQAPRGKWRDAGVVVGPQRLAVWRVLDAQFFGVAQRRRRIFLISVALRHPRAWAITESIFPLSACLSWNPPSRGEARKIAASGVGGGPDGGSISGAVMRKWAKGSGGPAGDECYNMVAQPVEFTRCDNGQDAAVDVTPTMRCGSNYSAHLAVAQPVAFHPTQDPISSVDGTTHAMGCGSKQGTATVAVAIRTANTGANGHGIAVDVTHTPDQAQGQAVVQPVAPALTASNDPSRSPQSSEVTAQVLAVMQATAQPVAFKVRGGVEVDSAGKAAGKGYLGSEETAFTLAATQDQWLAAPPAMQVRRLTPTECERLQGFPDGYTNIPWRKKPECPDGPRYKALGNSMAVPCMRWIAERIQAATARQESP